MPAITAEADGFDLGPPGLLLESYLDGSEHLIEACVWDGEAYLGSIVDRLEPHGQAIDENVHCAPSSLRPDQVESVRAAVEAGARGQRLRRSVLQVEVRFHGDRPYLVEIGARPGGGGLDRMARLSCGHDPIRCLVDVAVGRRPTLRHYRPTGVHTAAMVLLSAPGRVERIEVPDDLPDSSEVFHFRLAAKPGDVIRRPPEGNDILGFLGMVGPSRTAALSSLNDFAHRIEAHVRPVASRN
jgi:biotin carboxylase